MAIVMNMSNYEIELSPETVEHAKIASVNNWNQPELRLAQHQFVSAQKNNTLPSHLASANSELFLNLMQHN